MCGCHNGKDVAIGSLAAEARDAAEYPTMHKDSPHRKGVFRPKWENLEWHNQNQML